jgi:LacI family transcriptional regulator
VPSSHGRPGLRDVALLAGVSESTASRALSRSRQVRPELRERVLAAAAKLNYQANPHAQALAGSRDPSIGVVVHDVSDPYFSEIICGALDGAEMSGRMLLICNTYRDPEREIAYIRHFRALRADGLILAGSGYLDREIAARISSEILGFERGGGHAVLIGRHATVADSVLPDNADGSRQMSRYLAELGHRRIGVISGPPTLTSTQDRLTSFQKELAIQGVPLRQEQIRYGRFNRADGEKAAGELLAAITGLTAIFAMNDVMAIGALAALRQRGLRVPEDVSVAGFDDIPVAADLSPALTTIHVPLVEIGRRASALALEPHTDGFRAYRLGTELIVRASTAPPPRPR